MKTKERILGWLMAAAVFVGILLMLAGLARASDGTNTDVYFPLLKFTQQATTNRNVLITPLSLTPPPGIMPVYDRVLFNTGTNGNFWVSNMTAGTYQFDIQAPPDRQTRYFVITTNYAGAAVSVDSIITASPKNVYAPDTVPYSASASDQRYAPIGVVGNPNVVTNRQTGVTLSGTLHGIADQANGLAAADPIGGYTIGDMADAFYLTNGIWDFAGPMSVVIPGALSAINANNKLGGDASAVTNVTGYWAEEFMVHTNRTVTYKGKTYSFPNTTTACLSEIQAMYPPPANSSGTEYEPSVCLADSGFYDFSTQIGITNGIHLHGQGKASTFLRYVGSTNISTIAMITNLEYRAVNAQQWLYSEMCGLITVYGTQSLPWNALNTNNAGLIAMDGFTVMPSTNFPCVLMVVGPCNELDMYNCGFIAVEGLAAVDAGYEMYGRPNTNGNAVVPLFSWAWGRTVINYSWFNNTACGPWIAGNSMVDFSHNQMQCMGSGFAPAPGANLFPRTSRLSVPFGMLCDQSSYGWAIYMNQDYYTYIPYIVGGPGDAFAINTQFSTTQAAVAAFDGSASGTINGSGSIAANAGNPVGILKQDGSSNWFVSTALADVSAVSLSSFGYQAGVGMVFFDNNTQVLTLESTPQGAPIQPTEFMGTVPVRFDHGITAVGPNILSGTTLNGSTTLGGTATVNGPLIVTNATAATTITSNSVSTAFSTNGTLSVTNVEVAQAMSLFTNKWAGPNNLLDFANSEYSYATTTPVSITGFANYSGNALRHAELYLLNTAASPVALSLPTGITTADGARNYTVTNGILTIVSVSCLPNSFTNVIVRPMW